MDSVTEQQPYQVVARYPDFELRRYPAHVVAEVEVAGSFTSAGNTAFRPLAGYIGGRNRSQQQVAMTAPVLQRPAERIPMTAPVLQQEGPNAGRHLVSFVMPAGSTAQSLPVPSDPQVTIRDVPAQLAAARRFSGRWSQAAFERHAAALRRAVEEADLTIEGPLRFARFDPPWTPPFLRRNEVVAPVAEPASRTFPDRRGPALPS